MRSLGKVVGRSRSGRVIVRGDVVPPMRAAVVNKDLELVGHVGDVFGPFESPYVSVVERRPSAQVSPEEMIYFLTDKDRRPRRWTSSKRAPTP
jgi:rRNA processing protein Gar1